MANILSVEKLTHRWGEIDLFNEISFGLSEGDKAALIARNGTGKTTLLDIIAGKTSPNAGDIVIRKGIEVAYLNQNPQFDSGKNVIDAVLDSASEISDTVKKYQAALYSNNQQELNRLVASMDRLNAWDFEERVKQILSRLKIEDYNKSAEVLSGGEAKRVALAAALINKPDFLILDEPTNHLDLDMVEWLEEYLKRDRATLLMVTHDRFFLDKVCNVIYELDDQTIYRYQGNYSYFIEKREERRQSANAEVEKARNLMRKEQEWMNKTPQARSTKAKYRIDAFYDLKERASRQIEEKDLNLDIKSHRLGKKVVNLHNVSKGFAGKQLIDNFSYKFSPGEKVGIIGKNGTGKSTLLNIITGSLKPETGVLERGETVVFGYYRQEGIKLDENKRVIEVISDLAEVISAVDGTQMSASRYLRYFLFPDEMHYLYVNKLSGGEKKRLYLMTVLMRNPNFLILDEPTNDLDIFTLNVLEEYLQNFKGCVVIVSHDRFFLDKVVDKVFAFESGGKLKDFPGNYSQYAQHTKQKIKEKNREKGKKSVVKKRQVKERPRKKSFNEKKEFEQIEKDIEKLEQEKAELENSLSSGSLSGEELNEVSLKLGEILKELDSKEERWLNLSEIPD
ncbi:ABC-F family ATP-binding cassette domain-containing protein [Marinilabiliaceae bacterium ANBcel2]|nr:ABC-F family ATP-binding cassette domain-containing protein [Marinilabiliaceae bacterium ANBcel2]